jgi:hypothetical protein
MFSVCAIQTDGIILGVMFFDYNFSFTMHTLSSWDVAKTGQYQLSESNNRITLLLGHDRSLVQKVNIWYDLSHSCNQFSTALSTA